MKFFLFATFSFYYSQFLLIKQKHPGCAGALWFWARILRPMPSFNPAQPVLIRFR
jgi:hypothetical protein